MFRLEYFWALCVVLGLFGVWRLRESLRPLITADPSLEHGARVLVRTIVVLVLVVAGVNCLLGYFGGFSYDPGWWAGDIRNPYVLAIFIFHCIGTVVILWWTWLANGPARLLKYRAAFSTGQNPMILGETGMKWLLTMGPLAFLIVRVVEIAKAWGR